MASDRFLDQDPQDPTALQSHLRELRRWGRGAEARALLRRRFVEATPWSALSARVPGTKRRHFDLRFCVSCRREAVIVRDRGLWDAELLAGERCLAFAAGDLEPVLDRLAELGAQRRLSAGLCLIERADQLHDELLRQEGFTARLRGLALKVDGVFGDIAWPHATFSGDFSAYLPRLLEDPAFRLVGRSRYLALHRVVDQLRYYAGPISVGGADFAEADGPRQAEILKERPEEEIGLFDELESVARFADAYLFGARLSEIEVPRHSPPF